MKKLLILVLLSFTICEKSIFPSIISSILESNKCLFNFNILYDSFNKIVESIKTKDLLKIISTGFSVFQNIKEEFSKCKEKQKKKAEEEEDDIQLGYPRPIYVLATIIGDEAFEWYDESENNYSKFRQRCVSKYGQTAWFCNYFRKKD